MAASARGENADERSETMTPIALTFLVCALTIIWGGLVASIVFLSRRSEVATYPDGGDDLAHERIE